MKEVEYPNEVYVISIVGSLMFFEDKNKIPFGYDGCDVMVYSKSKKCVVQTQETILKEI